jgi:hypothetical protein
MKRRLSHSREAEEQEFERLPTSSKMAVRRFAEYRQLLPILREVAHSIKVANQADDSKWGIRVGRKDIMLKVGFVEVLQAGDGWFHQLVKGVFPEENDPTKPTYRRLGSVSR